MRQIARGRNRSTGSGFGACTINRRALSALLPTQLFGVALSCPFPNAQSARHRFDPVGGAIKMEIAMSIIDQALKANERYAKTYNPKWGEGPPRPKIAVVTCMDPRLSDLPGILGLKHADIDVIQLEGLPLPRMFWRSCLYRRGCSAPKRSCS